MGPLAALRSWLDEYAAFVMAKAGLTEALRAGTAHSQLSQEAYGPVTRAIEVLLLSNEAAGAIRHGFTADDVLLAIDGVYNLDPASEWQPRVARLFDLVVAGLRP